MPDYSEPWLIIDHNFDDFLPIFKQLIADDEELQDARYLLCAAVNNQSIFFSWHEKLYETIKDGLKDSCRPLETWKAHTMVVGLSTERCYGNRDILS